MNRHFFSWVMFFAAFCTFVRSSGVVSAQELQDALVSSNPSAQFHAHRSFVHALAFSPDGNMLATAGGDSTASLWDAGTLQKTATLHNPQGYVYSVAFSPDGQMLATAGWDGDIRLWNVGSGTLIAVFQGDGEPVYSLDFSPDGTMLAEGGWNKTARIRRISDGSEVFVLKGHGNYISSVAFTGDGQTLATGSGDGTARIWSSQTGELLRVLSVPEERQMRIVSLDFSPDGSVLACAAQDGKNSTYWWNWKEGRLLNDMREYRSTAATSLAYSPLGNHLASVGTDYALRIFSGSSGAQTAATTTLPADCWLTVAYSPNGNKIAAATLSGKVFVWDAQKETTPLPTFSRGITTQWRVEAAPNPAKTIVEITVFSMEATAGSLRLTDAVGKTVMTLSQAHFPKGYTVVSADISHLASGVYYAVMENGAAVQSTRIDIVK